MGRSLKMAGAFAIAATIVVFVAISGGVDSLLDSPRGDESLLAKLLFFGSFWPALVGQRFFPNVDGFFFIVFGWALVGFIVGVVWWRLSSHSYASV